MNDLVLYEVKDRVGYITLNRPAKRNALSYDFVSAIKDQLTFAQNDSACKVIVLKANGDAFCSGADLASLQKLQSNTREENIADSEHLAGLYRQIYESPKVTMARVEGAAFAGGCGLAAICDFTYASNDARFAYTEVKIGFVPAIVMVFLVRQIGEKAARQLLLTGDIIDAGKAHDFGIVNAVFDPLVIEDEVHHLAVKMCRYNSAQSLEMTRGMIGRVNDMSIHDALNYAVEMNAMARASDDCKKGISAFLNKEKLTW